jgi:hypothetical protein
MGAAEQFLEAQKAIWSSGDWPGFAPVIQDVAVVAVEQIGTAEGHDFPEYLLTKVTPAA